MRKLIAVAVLLAGAVILWPSRPEAGGPCTVPKAWGRAVGIQPGPAAPMVAFEAEDGTVRFTPANCGSPAKSIYTIERN